MGVSMKVLEKILKESDGKKLHFALLDPEDQSPKEAGRIAKLAQDAGSSAIMVGGSTISSVEQVDATVKAIKESCDLPVILFPTAAKLLSPHADALFFMSLMNSRNLDFVMREHVKGAPYVKHVGLEPISMGYVVVEPGMTVGRVGEVDLLKKQDCESAVGYALSAQYLGMSMFYLEAGSGAPEPVANEMIGAVKKHATIPVVVGGGIRDAKTAAEKVAAGADIIVTGTMLEQDDPEKSLREIIKAIRS